MKIKPVLFFFFFGLASLSFSQKQESIHTGLWQGFLKLNDSITLPFYFGIVITPDNQTQIVIRNAEERIVVNEVMVHHHFLTQNGVTTRTDSINFKMPVFDSEFKCSYSGDSMRGLWINHSKKDHNKLGFIACKADNPVVKGKTLRVFKGQCIFDGRWEVTFSPGTKDSSKAIGIFKQSEEPSVITGTFLTESGDYRFLQGEIRTNISVMNLGCFDGSHTFYFDGMGNYGNTPAEDKIEGEAWYSPTSHEKWIARRNNKFELRNPDSLTFLKKEFDKIDFNFKNIEGKLVSLNDEKYKNKVVVVQIMGSWCPNCMDETKYLADEYDKYKAKGLEVIALAFERTPDFAKSAANLKRLKTHFNASYDFLITGKTGAAGASEALPMLNAVMAFPTSIYIDKKGKVRKIYTGFSGPGTGIYYEKFKEENERFLLKLLSE